MKKPQLLVLATLLCASAALGSNALAGGKATDPAPSASPAPSTGGGGANSRKPTPTPTPAPKPAVQPIYTAPLTFTAAATLNNTVPQCTGSYQVDPYYPTLSLLTVSVHCSAMNVPDGTLFYVYVHGVSGTIYGPNTSNAIPVAAAAGNCSISQYLTPGTVIQSVVVADSTGAVILNGN